jgi:hypothetical protein
MPGLVFVSGRWKPCSGKSGTDLGKNAVEIQWHRDLKECFEATAKILDGEPIASLQDYRIIEWDANGIIAEDDSAICIAARLLVNFQEQTVLAIDTPKKDAKGMPLGNGKNLCQLVKGTETYNLVQ